MKGTSFQNLTKTTHLAGEPFLTLAQRFTSLTRAGNLQDSLYVIDMKNKKLKKAQFNISSSTKDINQIEGQDEVSTLHLSLQLKPQEVVDLVCRDFKSLEFLELSCDKTINLAGLQNLKKLKKLVVSSSTSIASIKSKSLEVLEVQSVTKEFLMNISLNCPSLRELHLFLYASGNVTLSEVLECLPKLEKLRVSATNFNCVSIFKHLNLKHLTLICYGSSEKNFNNLISLVRSCKNLETLSTNVKFENEEFKTLLQSCLSLKSLCLRERLEFKKLIDGGFFQVLRTHGQNLHAIHFPSSNQRSFDMNPTELLKMPDFIKNQFPLFTYKGQPNITELLMSKTGNEPNCCELNVALVKKHNSTKIKLYKFSE